MYRSYTMAEPIDADVVDEAGSPRDRLNRLREARERRRTQMQEAYNAADEDVHRLEEELADAKRLRSEMATEMARAGVPLPKRPPRATVREAREAETPATAAVDTVRENVAKAWTWLKTH